MDSLDDLLESLETVVTDSCPIKINVTKPEEEEEEEEDDEDADDVPSDNDDDSFESWDQKTVQAGNIQIADSSRVHVGNMMHDHRQFHVGKTNTVMHHVIDMRRINVQCHRSETAGKLKQGGDAEHVRKVEQFLRNLYKSCLSLTTPLPWCKDFTLHLEEFYVSLQIIRTTRRGHYSTTLEKLFSAEEWSGPIRLLVEGNPGYGKTTLAIRLCTDWARGAPYLQSFVLVFLVQLRDFRGDLQSYIFKERYPQEEEESMRDDLWSYVINNQEKVLFILDGLDELAKEHAEPIRSLVRGQLLQRVGVVVTSRPLHSGHDLLRAFPTRVVLQGFTDEQVRNFVSKYFAGAHNPLSGQELTRIIFDSQYSVYRSLSTCPLMCQLICVFFEDEGQGLPRRMTDVYLSLIRCLLSRNLIRNGKGSSSPGTGTISSDHEQMLKQFGRLCLEALLANRAHFTSEEVSAVTDLDFLVKRYELCSKSRAASGGQGECYQPLHSMFIEFLAAYYLRSLVGSDSGDPSALRQELKRLEPTSRHVPSRFLVLKFLMGLLGEEAHRYLPLMSAFNLPPVFLFDLLKESGTLPQSASSLATSMDQEMITVYSGDVELEGWGHVIADPSCIVKTLEFRRTHSCSEENLENFFTALAVNLSLDNLTLEFPYRTDMSSTELQRLSHYVGLALRKKNLRTFFLKGPIRTGLVEDDGIEEGGISQPMVDTIAASVRVHHHETLQSLTLEIDLDSGQLRQLKQAIMGMPNLRHLTLSKLWCGVRGFQAIAALMVHHPSLSELTVALNRSRVWSQMQIAGGDHQPGSPTDMKDLSTLLPKEARRRSRIMDDEEIKYEGEVSCSCGCRNEASPRASPSPGRVVLASDSLELSSFNHLFGDGNAVKLHFLKGTGYLDLKVPMPAGMTKSSRIPLPVCVSHESGFHHLFATLKQPSCHLSRLDLKECYLDKTDFACLGEALRKTRTLESFELVDQNLEPLLPLIVALSQNRTVRSLVLRSRNIYLDDTVFQLFCRSLCGNEVLRRLDISFWTMELKEARSAEVFSQFLTSTRLEELNLWETRVHLAFPTHGQTRPHEILQALCRALPATTTLQRLSLEQAELTLNENREVLNGGLLLPALTWCPNLKDLNLSVSSPVQNHGNLFLDDEMCRSFFVALAKAYGRTLERLHLNHWQFELLEPKKTVKDVEKSLRQCEKLTHLHIDNMQCPNLTQNSSDNRAWLLESMILTLPKLKLLSLVRTKLTPKQGLHLGQMIRDKWMGSLLVLQTKMVPEDAVQELLSTVLSAQRLQADYIGGFKHYLIIKAKTKPRRLISLVNPKGRN